MLNWVGNDQPMKMREPSRAIDKKLWVNNYWVSKRILLRENGILLVQLLVMIQLKLTGITIVIASALGGMITVTTIVVVTKVATLLHHQLIQ